jgi:hypothetical protein
VGNIPTGCRFDWKYWQIDLRELLIGLDRLLERDCEPFKPFMSWARASMHSVRDPCGVKTNCKTRKNYVFLALALANSLVYKQIGSQLPF